MGDAVGKDAQVELLGVEIIDQLNEHLPTHMVPSTFISVQFLPITATGKVDRRELRRIGSHLISQELAQSRLLAGKRQPTTELERQLQEIWAQVLNLDPKAVGVDDSFLKLGGDSITAMQVASSFRGAGITIRGADIIRQKTISNLVKATVVSKAATKTPQNQKHALATVGHRQPDEKGVLTQLGPIQRLHFAIQPDPTVCFDQCFLLELRRRVCPKTLNQALADIVKPHEALRWRFFMSETSNSWESYVTDEVLGSFYFSIEGPQSNRRKSTPSPLVEADSTSEEVLFFPPYFLTETT